MTVEIKSLYGQTLWKSEKLDSLYGADLSKADLCNARLSNANLSGTNLSDAKLTFCTGIVMFGPIGDIKRFGYIVTAKTSVNVKLGCFWGPLDVAIAAIQQKYGKNSPYQACVEAMANLLLNK